MSKNILLVALLCFAALFAEAQAPKKPSAADIHEALKRLNVLGSVLYVAAHPDDENTRLISYMVNDRHFNTTYLSMTRGDGGQNLIGSELSELLGVLRTEELLMARGVDGGSQMFTRANDFGFSKNADETLRLWNEPEVLSDVVWAIRQLQPDVIINRFPAGKEFDTHGHHTSSAILSVKAFDLAGKADAYPGQLKLTSVWQPKRLFFNTTWFVYGSQEKFDQVDKSDMVKMDMGVYLPEKGKSNSEIASESRSMHRCQGMGNLTSRGTEYEYLQFLKGDLQPKTDVFEGINTTWSRLDGGAPIGQFLAAVYQNFNYTAPSASVPNLLKARKMIAALPEGRWKSVKLKEIDKVIVWCCGIFAEATTRDYSAAPGQEIEAQLEAINRSAVPVTLLKARLEYSDPQHPEAAAVSIVSKDSVLNAVLPDNQRKVVRMKFVIPASANITNPYWLNETGNTTMYAVENQALRGLPETPRAVTAVFDLAIDGEPIRWTTNLVNKYANPAKGEIYRPFEIVPPVFAQLTDKVYVFPNDQPKTVSVTLKAGKEKTKGALSLQTPAGWRSEPASILFDLGVKNEEKTFAFQVFPPKNAAEGKITPVATVGGQPYSRSLRLIEYDHIPTQTVMMNAAAKAVRLDIKKQGSLVGYFMGAGDEVPGALEQMGYQVQLLDDKDFDHLDKFDAIVMGVRAYNTKEKLKFYQPKLLSYVENGGNLIVQYNTNGELATDRLGPYPMKLSRDRVSVEEAPIRFLKPESDVLNKPNKITEKDFDGWVQERGLNFVGEWDPRYEAILSCNDPNEKPRDGGLLVAKYGKGYYTYTAYSWFRELPAGVPGAFRLFANLLSLGGGKARP